MVRDGAPISEGGMLTEEIEGKACKRLNDCFLEGCVDCAASGDRSLVFRLLLPLKVLARADSIPLFFLPFEGVVSDAALFAKEVRDFEGEDLDGLASSTSEHLRFELAQAMHRAPKVWWGWQRHSRSPVIHRAH